MIDEYFYICSISCSRCQPNSEQFDNFLKKINPDAVIFDRFIMEEQFSFKLPSSTLKILDTQDLHFLRIARMAYVEKNDTIANQVLNYFLFFLP